MLDTPTAVINSFNSLIEFDDTRFIFLSFFFSILIIHSSLQKILLTGVKRCQATDIVTLQPS